MPKMLSLIVQTKQCSNEEQLTSNLRHTQPLLELDKKDNNIKVFFKDKQTFHLRWEILLGTKLNLPPLFFSFSSSCFFSSSMSFFNLAFSTISFFSSLTLAWTTAMRQILVTTQSRSYISTSHIIF